MKLFSKELLLSGGKKIQLYKHDNGSYIAYTVGEPKAGNYCFTNMDLTADMCGTLLSVSETSISVKESRATYTGNFFKTVEIEGFVFNCYQLNTNGYVALLAFLSPKQQVGDKVYFSAMKLPSNLVADIPSIRSVSGTSFVADYWGSTQTFPIQNTPITDYIYRA